MEIQEKRIKERMEDDSIRRKYSRLYTEETEGKKLSRESWEMTAKLWNNRRRNTALNKKERITLY